MRRATTRTHRCGWRMPAAAMRGALVHPKARCNKKAAPCGWPEGAKPQSAVVHTEGRQRLVRRRARDSLNRLDLHGTDLVFRHLRGGVKRGIREPVGIAVLEMERHPCLTGICLARHTRRSFDFTTAARHAHAIAIGYAKLFSVDPVQLDERFSRNFIETFRTTRHGASIVLSEHATGHKHERVFRIGKLRRRTILSERIAAFAARELSHVHDGRAGMVLRRAWPLDTATCNLSAIEARAWLMPAYDGVNLRFPP